MSPTKGRRKPWNATQPEKTENNLCKVEILLKDFEESLKEGRYVLN